MSTFVSAVAFIGSLLCMMLALFEGAAFIRGVIHALFWPNVVLGPGRSARRRKPFSILERVGMGLRRWLYRSPIAHQLYCTAGGKPPYFRSAGAMVFAALLAALFHNVTGFAVVQCVGLAVACGGALFASTQGRNALAAYREWEHTDASEWARARAAG